MTHRRRKPQNTSRNSDKLLFCGQNSFQSETTLSTQNTDFRSNLKSQAQTHFSHPTKKESRLSLKSVLSPCQGDFENFAELQGDSISEIFDLPLEPKMFYKNDKLLILPNPKLCHF